MTRFVFNGWSLIAQFDDRRTPRRSYVWGLDISRTLNDAGGVKGLLMTRDHLANKRFFPAYDGNGKVTALVERTSRPR